MPIDFKAAALAELAAYHRGVDAGCRLGFSRLRSLVTAAAGLAGAVLDGNTPEEDMEELASIVMDLSAQYSREGMYSSRALHGGSSLYSGWNEPVYRASARDIASAEDCLERMDSTLERTRHDLEVFDALLRCTARAAGSGSAEDAGDGGGEGVPDKDDPRDMAEEDEDAEAGGGGCGPRSCRRSGRKGRHSCGGHCRGEGV